MLAEQVKKTKQTNKEINKILVVKYNIMKLIS